MNFLTESTTITVAIEALGMTILHSLWQGFLLMFLLAIFLRFGKPLSSGTRFAVAFASLLIFFLAFAGTFYWHWDSPEQPSTNALPIELAAEEITVNATDLANTAAEPIIKIETNQWEIWLTQLNSLAPWLAWLWVVGSFVFALRLVNGLVQSQRLRYRTQPLGAEWKKRVQALAQQLGIRQKVSFASTTRTNTPLTIGWIKPIVLIPASLLTMMPSDQLEAIFIHELAHIKRRDYLWNLIQSVAEVVLFYHPAYWYMASVLERERELACDALTVATTQQPRVYAQALLQIAERSSSVPLQSVAASGKRGLAGRIQQIVYPSKVQRNISVLPFVLLLSLISLSLAAFSWYQPDLTMMDNNEVVNSSDSPVFSLQNGHGTMDSIFLQPIRQPDTNSIDYGPSFQEVMTGLSDEFLDTTNLTVGEMHDQALTIDQALNQLSRSAARYRGDSLAESPVNYANPSVIYLLDDEIVNPKQVKMFSVKNLDVFRAPFSSDLQGLVDREYSIVVRATSKNNVVWNTQGSLRIPDYIGYGEFASQIIPLPRLLALQSEESYLIGQSNFSQSGVNPREFFQESTLYLLDGEVMDDPSAIMLNDIRRFEIYYNPLPSSVQNLADRQYSAVVRVFSREYQQPKIDEESFSVGGQVITRQDERIQPVPGIKVEVKESGKLAITDNVGKFQLTAAPEETLIFHLPEQSPLELAINGREFFHISTHIPKRKNKRYEELQERLIKRMSETSLAKDRKAIQRETNALDKAINSLSPQNETDSINLSHFHTLDPAKEPLLYVVNGAIQTNEKSISAIDPGNISTIETLKGDEAQLWFGKEGDNGAILIRTKDAPPPKVIKGNVFSGETRQPLAGVSLSIKGKELAVSDRNGYYRVEIPNYSSHFTLSQDGYETIRPISNGYASWPAKLYLRPVPSPEEIASLYQEYVVQKVPGTLYSINGALHMSGEPIPKLEMGDIESIRVIEGEGVNKMLSETSLKGKYDQVVTISTKASYQYTPISFSNANALYVIDGRPEEDRTDLSDFQSEDIVSVETVGVKDNRDDQFEGLPVEGKDQVIFVTTKNFPSSKVIGGNVEVVSGLVFNSSTKQGIEGIKVIASDGSTATTDEQGLYQINLPPNTDKTVFEFTHPDYPPQTIDVNTNKENDVLLGISRTSNVKSVIKTFAAKNYKTIRGRIQEVETGDGIAGVKITATNGSTAETDEEGNYKIQLPAATQKTFFEFTHPDYPKGRIEVDATKTKGINLRFRKDPYQAESTPKLQVAQPDAVDLSNFQLLDSAEQPPIFIIDGVIYYDKEFPKNLAPTDIQFIETVKGREAQKRYGKEALGGAILITTKNPPSSKVIRGKITDEETGKPLMGVHISGRGTTIGTATDLNGNYRISVPKKTKGLKFSANGYGSGGIVIGNRKVVNVELLPDPFIDLENALFVIDGQIREDIRSFNDVEALNLDIVYTETFKENKRQRLPLEYHSKGYNKVVRVVTKSFQPQLAYRTALGKLVDERSGEPLVGAEVNWMENGKRTIVTRTDEQGEYKVTLPEEMKVIEYSYPGYTPIGITDRHLIESFPMRLTLPLERQEQFNKKYDFNHQLFVSPNPGNDEINVKFTLAEPTSVEFELLDKEGNLLHSVEYHYSDEGRKEVAIPTTRFPANVYLLRINAGDLSFTRRVILE